jgi:exodeoxyribonuclease I
MTDTFYWHDYETFGTDPQRDRAVQFAGVRTDTDLNIIDDPLVIYCKPAADCLPQPDACLITGITPQLTEAKGICEAEFICHIHQQIAQPGTITAGYNNIRFDDEVTRNLLYRNFYDPYSREWQHGNSRWDIIDLVRATRALRPEGIVWPDREDGKPSFRLEDLTLSNGIEHTSAHDALADVKATIAFAKLIKQQQPKLYHFILKLRAKAKVLDLLKLGSMQPVLHVSGMYPSIKGCIAVVLPICKHPANPNGVIVYDLAIDPEPLFTLSAEQLQQRIFTSANDLPEGVERIPLKTVHINKCPVVAPLSVLLPEDQKRLQIDLDNCWNNLQKIKKHHDLSGKLHKVFGESHFTDANDPDLMLYSGGFFNNADKAKMQRIREMEFADLSDLNLPFKDPRIPEMLFRYRARNAPETLTESEQQRWRQFCVNRLTDRDAGASIVLEDYLKRLVELKQQNDVDQNIIKLLEDYAENRQDQLGITRVR